MLAYVKIGFSCRVGFERLSVYSVRDGNTNVGRAIGWIKLYYYQMLQFTVDIRR